MSVNNLAKAKRVKEGIRTGEGVVDGASTFTEVKEVSGMSELLEISVEALDTDNESIDPYSFNLHECMNLKIGYCNWTERIKFT